MAIQVSVIWNFLLHNLFTFREPSGRHQHSNVIISFSKYEGAVLLSQTLMLGMYSLLTWFGLQFLVAQLIGIVTAFVVNYHLSITYIWNKPGDHAE
jgi:putative flippase GtrA